MKLLVTLILFVALTNHADAEETIPKGFRAYENLTEVKICQLISSTIVWAREAEEAKLGEKYSKPGDCVKFTEKEWGGPITAYMKPLSKFTVNKKQFGIYQIIVFPNQHTRVDGYAYFVLGLRV